MKIRPIIFSRPMIKALLADRKTQTRRLATSPLAATSGGARLWVRETWRPVHSADPSRGAHYRADVDRDQTVWRPSIHMPRWASRLTLDVSDVGLERLQDIDAVDAQKEGVTLGADGYWTVPDAPIPEGEEYTFYYAEDPVDTFKKLWTVLHGADAWARNPPVVPITFAVQARNVDAQDVAA